MSAAQTRRKCDKDEPFPEEKSGLCFDWPTGGWCESARLCRVVVGVLVCVMLPRDAQRKQIAELQREQEAGAA